MEFANLHRKDRNITVQLRRNQNKFATKTDAKTQRKRYFTTEAHGKTRKLKIIMCDYPYLSVIIISCPGLNQSFKKSYSQNFVKKTRCCMFVI